MSSVQRRRLRCSLRKVVKKKAGEALLSGFDIHERVSLAKLKSDAERFCNKVNLPRPAKSIGDCKNSALILFYSAKTHKLVRPLRINVPEKDTWQNQIALSLQNKLNLFGVDDPFTVKDSTEVVRFLSSDL